jgi:hypothetical protein
MPTYSLVMIMLAAFSLGAAVLVLTLLALPPANRFFRRPPSQPYPMWAHPNPPYQGQPYPAQPFPGQQYPGQHYPR